MQAKGSKGQLILAYETAYGQTPSLASAVKLPFNKNTLTARQTLTESQTITGRRDATVPVRGKIDVNGNLVVPMDAKFIGYWLKAMFGTPATTGSDPYTHVFKPGDSMPSLVLEKGFTDINAFNLYNGGKVNNFSLSLGGDSELTASIDILGAKETVGADSFVTTPLDLPLVRFNNFQAPVEEGGQVLANCTGVDLTIGFGLDGDIYSIGGQGCRTAISEGPLQVSGTVDVLFEDQTLLNKAINGTESSLKITLTNGGYSFELLLPEIVYERTSPGIESAKGILINLPFKGYYENNAAETSIQATLVNDVASYAM